jgi:hypothetical protein
MISTGGCFRWQEASRMHQAKWFRSSLGFLQALVAALTLCACSAELPTTCPPPDVTFPVAISRITPLPMPLGQFLGRTREQNETLLTPQPAQVLTGWVTYAPGFSIRYQGQQAVALKATLDIGAPWQEIVVWAGFQPAAAPVCQGEVCRWKMGTLCYDSLPLAATWNSTTGELHVWQAQASADWRPWVGYGLLAALHGAREHLSFLAQLRA